VFKFCGNENRIHFLLKDLPEDQVWRQPGVSAATWPQIVSSFDIGLAPLDMRPVPSGTGNEHGEFSYDERRSWLKCVEYACGGVPFVASKSATYDAFKRYGLLVDNTPEAWYKGLKTRVDSLLHFRQEAYGRRRNNLKRYTIESQAQRLIDFYIDIGERSQAMEGALFPDIKVLPAKPSSEWEALTEPLYTGDPLEVGYKDHGTLSRETASSWYKNLNLHDQGYDVGDMMEYSVRASINARAKGPRNDGQEPA
jgi:hypothetical protein